MKWTWWMNEIHRGAELLCDTCNEILDIDSWYYRSPSAAEYPSYCVCGDCKRDIGE